MKWIKNLFKPSWIVLEVHHERYTFDTYYTYCRHMTLKEVEDMFMLDPDIKQIDRNGAYTYDECGTRWEGEYRTYDAYLEKNVVITSYGISYTIVIPAKKRNIDQYFICGLTKNKFGLFDRQVELYEKDSTDK